LANLPTLVVLDKLALGPNLNFDVLNALPVNITQYDMTVPEQVIERCSNADIVITNKVVLNAECLKNSKVSLIGVAATGMNNIDLEAAKSLGISVRNVEGYAGSSIAQHVFALMTQLMGNIGKYTRDVTEGKWQQSPFFCLFDYPMRELSGKTLGIIGFGTLAKSVIKIAEAFEMNVIVAERKSATRVRDKRFAFNDVIERSDIISIHCPLTTQTENLIGVSELKTMKSNAILINTARGGIVNESALVAALEHNWIGAAATDVLTQEPPKQGNPLLDYKGNNLIITPHIAWATIEARQRLLDILVSHVEEFIHQGKWRQ
jgi:glycerate dehydrogenase